MNIHQIRRIFYKYVPTSFVAPWWYAVTLIRILQQMMSRNKKGIYTSRSDSRGNPIYVHPDYAGIRTIEQSNNIMYFNSFNAFQIVMTLCLCEIGVC